MALYEIVDKNLKQVENTTFSREGVQERRDLQEMLKNNIGIIVPDAMVLAEEYGEWEDSRRRIDLLCLDREARLIVVELKRTEDGGHMDLQAIRYAAMVSKMTFSEVVKAHAEFKEIGEADAEAAILEFLDWDEIQEDSFADDVKIVLVSSEFSKEITSAVMWLSEFDVDFTCVRLRPYKHDGKLLVDVQKIFPLPEAEDYQVKIRHKEREGREIRIQNRDMTRYDLTIDGKTLPNLPKRELVYWVINKAISKGFRPHELVEGAKFWVYVDGKHDQASFLKQAQAERAEGSSNSHIDRFYTSDEKLFYVDGNTYALTRMWGSRSIPTVERIIKACKLEGATYMPSKE